MFKERLQVLVFPIHTEINLRNSASQRRFRGDFAVRKSDKMTDNLNLRHLISAVEIQKLGSIRKASERVHVSQSALTQGIHKLEARLGFELFSRFHDGLRPTEMGETFLLRARRALAYLTAMDAALPRPARSPGAVLARSLTSAQLRALVAVVDRGSYTLAARKLGLAQPSVHRAVKHVEAVCGGALLNKTPAGLEPTWQARELARLIALYFHELAQGEQEVAELRGQMTGRLRVGSLPLARTRMVPQAVTRLLKDYPQAEVSIVEGPYEEQLHALLHGRLDVIVGALRYPKPSAELEQRKLFTDKLSIAFRPGHPLQNQGILGVENLRNLSWIAPREDTPAREAFSRFFEQHDLPPPQHIVECSSLVATRGMLLDSDRVALLSAKQLEVDIQAGLLALGVWDLPGVDRDIGITTRRDWRPTRIQRQFLGRLQNAA